MVELFNFTNLKNNIFTIPIDDNYNNNCNLNSNEDYNFNSVFRVNYFENFCENFSDKNSYDSQHNFFFSTMLKKNWKNKVKKFLGKSIFKYKKLILFVEKRRNHVIEI